MLQQLVRFDLSICLFANKACRARWIRLPFAAVSRLGNGVFWYSLMAALPLLHGREGLAAAAHMLVVGLCGYLIYRVIKQGTVRPRPCSVHEAITLGADPLDQYSFPSGHTLHAVSFTLIALHYFPELAWLLTPFTVLVAASRVVLGLHYPTDVACGALIGAVLGLGSTALIG